MKMAEGKAAQAIRTLIMIARNELKALADRDFQALSTFAEKRHDLLKTLEDAAARGGEVQEARIAGDLEKLRTLSSEGAAQLSLLRESVIRARARIENLAAADRSTGLYGDTGRIMPARKGGGREA